MTFLAAHWKALLLAAAFGAVAAWLLKPNPQPSISKKVDDAASATSAAQVDEQKLEGPWSADTWYYGCPAPKGAGREDVAPGSRSVAPAVPAQGLIAHRREEHGATSTDTHSGSAASSASTHKLDLQITPQARAGWQLQAGLEDVLHAQTLRLAARRRLFGPFWMEVAVRPANRSLGAGLAVEW